MSALSARFSFWRTSTTLRYLVFMLLVLVFMTSATACAAVAPAAPVVQSVAPPVVDAIHNGTSLWVMQQFVRGTPYSFALQNPQTLVTWFAAPLDDAQGWGTVAIDLAKQQPVSRWLSCGGSGTYFGCRDLSEMVKTGVNSGWKYIKPKDLPPEFPAWLASAASWLARSVSSFDILVVPIGTFDYNVLPDPTYR